MPNMAFPVLPLTEAKLPYVYNDLKIGSDLHKLKRPSVPPGKHWERAGLETRMKKNVEDSRPAARDRTCQSHLPDGGRARSWRKERLLRVVRAPPTFRTGALDIPQAGEEEALWDSLPTLREPQRGAKHANPANNLPKVAKAPHENSCPYNDFPCSGMKRGKRKD